MNIFNRTLITSLIAIGISSSLSWAGNNSQILPPGQDGHGENGMRTANYYDLLPQGNVILQSDKGEIKVNPVIHCRPDQNLVSNDRNLEQTNISLYISSNDGAYRYNLFRNKKSPQLVLITSGRSNLVVSQDLFAQAFTNELAKFWHVAEYFASQQEWSIGTYLPLKNYKNMITDHAQLSRQLANDTRDFLEYLNSRVNTQAELENCHQSIETLGLWTSVRPPSFDRVYKAFSLDPSYYILQTLPQYQDIFQLCDAARRTAKGSPDFLNLQKEFLQIWKKYDYSSLRKGLIDGNEDNSLTDMISTLNRALSLFGPVSP